MNKSTIGGHRRYPDIHTLDLFAAPASDAGLVRSQIPVYRVELVKERDYDGPACRTPADIAQILAAFLSRADREHFVTVMLATSNRVIGINVASVGTLNASLVNVREVFKPCILANAAQIVLGHNHPSGALSESREDVAVTKKLVEAGRLLDIPVLDHIIVGHGGAHLSLAELGLM